MSKHSLPDNLGPVKPELPRATGTAPDLLPVWCGVFLLCNVAQVVLILVAWLA
jgi:hypothetical protein